MLNLTNLILGAGLGILAVLAWYIFRTYRHGGVSGVAVFLSVIALLSIGVVAYLVFYQLKHVFESSQQQLQHIHTERTRLHSQVSSSNTELDTQREMLQAFLLEGCSDRIIDLSQQLLHVEESSFWRLAPHQDELQCLHASQGKAFKKGIKWHQEEYPAFFHLIEKGETIIYPPINDQDEPQRIGNLLHYIEENHIKRLLIVPVSVESGVTGLAWFEDREQRLSWTEKERRQASFVASIMRLELMKELQDGLIQDLSEGVFRMEHLRSQASFGIAWFRLEQPSSGQEPLEIQHRLVAKAKLEEANAKMMELFPQKSHLALFEKNLSELIPETALKQFVANNGQLASFEWDIETPQGNKGIKCELWGVSEGNELRSIWVIAQDVSTWKARIWEAETILANTSSIITQLDADGRILKDSQALQVFEYERQERQGHYWVSYFHHKDAELLESELRKMSAENGTIWCHGMRLRKGKGGYATMDVRIELMMNSEHASESKYLTECLPIDSRQQVEQALHQEKDFFRSVIDAGSAAIAVLDKEGHISFASNGFNQVFGYSIESRLGRYGFEYFHSDSVATATKAFERITDGEILSYKEECSFLHSNGVWKKVDLSLDARMDGRAVRGVVMRIEDISKQRPLADAMKNREGLLEQFLERSGRSFLLLSDKGQVRFATTNVQYNLGISREALVGSSLFQLIKPEEKGAAERALLRGEGASQKIFLNMQQPNQGWKQLAFTNYGKASGNAYTGYIASLEPAALEHPAEVQAEVQAELFKNMANTLPYPLLFADSLWQIRFANKACKEWLGYLPTNGLDSMLDKPSYTKVTAIGEDGEQQRMSLRVREHSGAYWQAYSHITPLKNTLAKGFLVVWEAPSDHLKQIEQELSNTRVRLTGVQAQLTDAQQKYASTKQQLEQAKNK